MIAKILKRRVSRISISEAAETPVQPPPPLPCQYEYSRPDLLGPYTPAELAAFASHAQRPVVTPKLPLACDAGYAEAINAGKSKLNEDQATVLEGSLAGVNGVEVPYVYLGLFDGHGGAGAGVKIAKELHKILHESLEDVLPYMLGKGEAKVKVEVVVNGLGYDEDSDEEEDEKEAAMTVDEMVVGALESSFWAMDRKILMQKETFRITGGATCLVALFVCDKLYVANAGDSRAAVYLPDQPDLMPMSFDFTPMADRVRLQQVAFLRPELLRHPQTGERLFNRHVLARRVGKEDVGSSVMYRDFYMTGWSCKDVTADDVSLVPMISGRGKQCRLLSTVGVARSLGDHDLAAKGCGTKVKEFLTPQPEVKVMDLRDLDLAGGEMLVLGTDGLWDVLSNAAVRAEVAAEVKRGGSAEEVARRLVTVARGERGADLYWEMAAGGRLASGDDVTAVAVFLGKARRV